MTYTIDLKLGTDSSSASVNDGPAPCVVEVNHADIIDGAAEMEKHDLMVAVALHLVQEVSRQRGDGPTSLDVSLPPDWDQSNVARLSEALAGSPLADPSPTDHTAAGPEQDQTDHTATGPEQDQTDHTATGPDKAARVGDMYQLPHISDGPLPDFMAKRGHPAQPISTDAAPVTPRATSEHPPPQPVAPAGTRSDSPPGQVTPASSARTLPPRDDVRISRGGFIVIALLLLAILGGAMYAAITARNAAADDSAEPDSAPTTSSSDESAAPVPTEIERGAGIVGAPCEAADRPDKAVEYRVSDVPDDLDRQTLNGRNIPSVRSINGVESVAVTEFPELSILPLTYDDCSIDHNGRAWWGATFDGRLVWVTTLFIEPAS